MQIATNNAILLNGRIIGLSVVQQPNKTIVYRPECRITGKAYVEYEMPHQRYALCQDNPASGVAGADKFEADIRALMKNTGVEA